METKQAKAFTLIELLVVVLILGLLSTVAVGVFTTQVERARYGTARATIQELSLALERYHVDLGEYPPSGSLTSTPVAAKDGCGFLQLALMHSLSGNSADTSGTTWRGPYISIQREFLGDFSGTNLEQLPTAPDPRDVQILDPWRSPYRYVMFRDYDDKNGTELPPNHPYVNTEVYYNPSTFQIVSKGGDSLTLPPPKYGTGEDDVTNFGM